MKLAKALYCRKTLQELYDKRSASIQWQHGRSRVAMSLAILLFLTLMAYVVINSWSRFDVSGFLDRRSDIVVLDEKPASFRWTDPLRMTCDLLAECYASVVTGKRHVGPLAEARASQEVMSQVTAGEVYYVLLESDLTFDTATLIPGYRQIFLKTPDLIYRHAAVYLNGKLAGLYHHGEDMTVSLDTRLRESTSQTLTVGILFETSLGRNGSFISESQQFQHPFYRNFSLLHKTALREYRSYLASHRQDRGRYVGRIAAITMAVFALVLFLVVDSSPETLGLSLFLGFEAVAISLIDDWLPTSRSILLQSSFQMLGAVFRLYFFLQLARVIRRDLSPWLVFGALYAFCYGYLTEQRYLTGFNPSAIGVWTHAAVAFVGSLFCLRVAWVIRDKKLPWRVVAMVLASVAVAHEWLQPILGVLVPVIKENPYYYTVLDLAEPMSAWMLSFSVFINISTLENRVEALSEMTLRAREMETQMQLGKSVQDSFMKLPELPDGVNFAFHHEALEFVSGDAYFVDWNARQKKLAFLINDVTGHGVQAALKASGVIVIARTLWSSPDRSEGRLLGKYAALTRDFFANMDASPDILALGGGEFDYETGHLHLLRVNFPFPILIERNIGLPDELQAAADARQDDIWRISILPLRNEEEVHLRLSPNSFIVISSDGFVDTSRKATAFLRHLRKELGLASPSLTADDIKTTFLTCQKEMAGDVQDDRTLLVFHWNPARRREAARKLA